MLKLQWNPQAGCDIVWRTTAAGCVAAGTTGGSSMRPDGGRGFLPGSPPRGRTADASLDRGAHLIIINNTPTYLNVRADVVILDDVASTFLK